eukprot:473303_1
MGSTCSQHTSTGKCYCFANDNKIKDVDIVRYSRAKWIWSTSHDLALINSLSDFQQRIIPNEIMILIKEHCYHPNEEFLTIHPILYREKYYYKNKLLQKKLCKHWYQRTAFSEYSFDVALYVSDKRTGTQVVNVLNTGSLPALKCRCGHFRCDNLEHIRRTIYIDNCQIRLHVMPVKHNEIDDKIIKYAMINIIVLNEYEPLLKANNTCRKIWEQNKSMKNCVIVWLQDRKTNKNSSNVNAMEQLAQYYNVPFLSLALSIDKTAADLFSFAVKYYWFCNVVE